MNDLSIDIDNLVLRLGASVTQERAKGIADNAVEMLEELIRNHSFDYSSSATGHHVDSIVIPSISITISETDMEISRAIACEIHRVLTREVGE